MSFLLKFKLLQCWLIRFDTQNCRIFIYFNSTLQKPQSEYYELRNTSGELVEEQKNIEKCFKEIKLA